MVGHQLTQPHLKALEVASCGASALPRENEAINSVASRHLRPQLAATLIVLQQAGATQEGHDWKFTGLATNLGILSTNTILRAGKSYPRLSLKAWVTGTAVNGHNYRMSGRTGIPADKDR